ncbi:hypothetical protein [Pseudomonas sp. FP1740]|uniref:hypothetical protein n=1 Tax=Pseudomonas sp. FP1740 TaxID=2954078 RepID=UPI002735F51F|nr:hypothetical protein [Pseudomonas sp. FP1740]WLG45011.1 hypothetical protein PSH69_29920 [Pseudomonas sp. FP1740]
MKPTDATSAPAPMLKIEMPEVFAFTAVYREWGIWPIERKRTVGILFPVLHTIKISSTTPGLLQLDVATGLLRATLDRAKATLVVKIPDVTKWRPSSDTAPFEYWKSVEIAIQLSGDSVLARNANGVGLQVHVGSLTCAAAPVFKALPNPSPGTKGSLLGSLWPTLSADGAELDYVFTPHGACLAGSLGAGMRDMLRLPHNTDLAWKEESDYFALLLSGKSVPTSNSTLTSNFQHDVSDWTNGDTPWTVRRWHILKSERKSVLASAFDRTFDLCPGLRFERMEDGSALSDKEWLGDILVHLTAPHNDKSMKIVVKAGLCVSERPVAVYIDWGAQVGGSVMSAERAIASWKPGSAPGGLTWVAWIMRTTADPNASAELTSLPELHVEWGGLGHTPTVNLAEAYIFYEGLMDAQDNIASDNATRPRWLATAEGLLEMSPEVFDAAVPESIRKGLSRPSQQFRGGVPLEALGGPPGLSVWISDDPARPAGQAVTLTVRNDHASLKAMRPLLEWRSPPWWVAFDQIAKKGDDPLISDKPLSLNRSQDGIPGLQSRLRAAFDADFATRPARDGADMRFAQALGKVFCGTRWVGDTTGPHNSAWTLELSGGYVTLTVPSSVPASAQPRVKAWSRFDGAYFVRTLPERDETRTGAVVDPLRALFPAHPKPKAPGIELRIEQGKLPAYAAPPFNTTGDAAPQWQRVAATGFHPHIAGLSLEGPPNAPARQMLRHGIQMHLESLLQATADGTLSGTIGSTALSSVRPSDDLAATVPEKADKVGTEITVNGWLPSPGQVVLDLVDKQLGDDQPRIEFKTAGFAQTFTLGAYHGADGFGSAAGIVLDQDTPQLTSSQQPGSAPMLNFGQPLMQLQTRGQTLDGAGRKQGLFDGEMRQVEPINSGGTAEPTCITAIRTAGLSWAGQPSSHVTLTLLDSEPGDLAIASWDLCGEVRAGVSSRPAIGPCALVARAIEKFDKNVARVTCKLAPPWSPPLGAALDDSPVLELKWEFKAGSWGLADVVPADIVWRFDDKGAGTRVVAMQVRIGGSPEALTAEVTGVELETDALGRIGVVVSSPAPLEWLDTPSGPRACCRIAHAIGLEVDMTLVGQPEKNGCAWEVIFSKCLTWGDAAGVRLTLAKEGSTVVLKGLHLGDAIDDVTLQTARASDTTWLLSATTADVAIAGTLEVTMAAHASAQFSIKASLKCSSDPRSLVAECDRNRSWLVVVANVSWNSQDPAAPALSEATVSGRIVFRNTFTFRQVDGLLWHDEVDAVFDGICCGVGQHGDLDWPGTLDLLAVHCLGPDGEPSRVEFAAVHQFLATRGTLACASLICLCEGEGSPAALEAQIVFGTDRVLGAAAIAPPNEVTRRGLLLRLPVKSGTSTVELRVPTVQDAKLDWLPLRRWATDLKPADDDPWHERRLLAACLSPIELGGLGAEQTQAHFSGGADWPGDNEELLEWAALGDVGRWPHSGFLAPKGGIFALPWHAGAMLGIDVSLDEGSTCPALHVELHAEAPDAPTGLRVFATGLVSEFKEEAGRQQKAVARWALDETTRRRHQGSALAIVRGRNELSLMLARPQQVRAVLRTSAAPVGSALMGPAHSYALELLFDGEVTQHDAPARQQAALAVAFDEGAVVEAAHALPRTTDVESATEFRLVLHSALTGDDWGNRVSFGLERRQAIHFGSQPDMLSLLPRARPSLVPAADGHDVIAAPLVDVAAWSVRPGDSVWTQWSAAAGASSAGPGVRMQLRSPRAAHTAPRNGGAPVGETFTLVALATATMGGAEWRLRELTRSRVIGKPFDQPFASLLTIATLRGVLHVLNIHKTSSTRQLDEPSVAITRVARGADGWSMPDRMVVGAFVATGKLIDEKEEWGLAVVSKQFVPNRQSNLVHDVNEMLSDRTLGWLTLQAPNAVSLCTIGTVEQLKKTSVCEPDAYTDNAMAALASLVAQTPRKLGEQQSAHWLHDSPRLALWRRAPGAVTVTFLPRIQILWIDKAAMESAPHVCTVSNNAVSGFGSMEDGPNGIELTKDALFRHWQCAYVLEWPSLQKTSKAWRFEYSGACSAISELP